jgi:hypothetical protein
VRQIRRSPVGPLSEWTYRVSQCPLARAALNGSESRATDPSVTRRSTLRVDYLVSQRSLVRAALNGLESRAIKS